MLNDSLMDWEFRRDEWAIQEAEAKAMSEERQPTGELQGMTYEPDTSRRKQIKALIKVVVDTKAELAQARKQVADLERALDAQTDLTVEKAQLAAEAIQQLAASQAALEAIAEYEHNRSQPSLTVLRLANRALVEKP